MIGVGVIGAGLMGSIHARLLAESISGAALVAVSDPVRERAQALGGVVYDDALELIAAADVDAVVIASPASTHESYALACLRAGKRVLCEKPLATTSEAALRIVEAERSLGRRLLTVGFMRRYDPGYVELKAQLDAGTIGPPLLLHCAHRNPSVHAFFDSAMIITDSAVHEVDVARWLLGEEIVRATVHAPRPTSRAREGLRDPLLLVFETASGRLVDVEAFVTAGFGYDIRCEVVGEAGTLELLAPSTTRVRADFAAAVAVPGGFPERFAAAYRLELQHWISGGDGPSAWDGYAAAAVCEAAVESLRRGESVSVNWDNGGSGTE